MTKNTTSSKSSSKNKKIKEVKSEITTIQQKIREKQASLKALTDRLEELALEEEESDTSSETDFEIGDHVISITDPHRGRTGVVIYAGNYWVRVRCDKNKKQSFKKAKTNLRLITE